METKSVYDPAMTGDRASEFAGKPKTETMRGLMEQRALESVVFLGEALSRVSEEETQGDAFTVAETILAQEGKTFYGEDGVKKQFSREREEFDTCFRVARKYADVERGIKTLHAKRELLNEDKMAFFVDRFQQFAQYIWEKETKTGTGGGIRPSTSS